MDYTIKLSQQDVAVITQALGELPLKMTLQTFASIQNQIEAANEAATTKESADAPPALQSSQDA